MEPWSLERKFLSRSEFACAVHLGVALCALWDSRVHGWLIQWFLSTRLEKRTKEPSTHASSWVAKLHNLEKFQYEHIVW